MSNLVLIGSAATHHWFPEFRKPGDYDYVGLEDVNNRDDKSIVEVKLGGKGFEWIRKNCGRIAQPSVLYTIKLSHAYWDVHWNKTMSDIEFFQRNYIKHIPQLYDLLYQDWCDIHGAKRAKLKEKNENFFKKTVKRKYEHDSIHESVKYGDRPMFERIKKDLSSAMCSEEMFNNLSYEDKLRLCREEIYTIALERFVIPNGMQKYRAYREAVRVLTTSATKGWFPKFIVFNWYSLNRPDCDYVRKFDIGVENGTVREVHRVLV